MTFYLIIIIMSVEDPLIDSFYSINPEIGKIYKIKKVKFALNQVQRDEILNLAKEINYKHYILIKTQLETGLRINEIRNLIIPQINLFEKYIKIEPFNANRYHSNFKPKTESGIRIVPISNELTDIFRQIIGKRSDGYLFQSNKKNDYGRYAKSSLIRIVNKYAKLSKSIKDKTIGSHSLRRTYASYLMNQNIKINDISKVLGHKTIKTTMIYLFEITDLESLKDIRKVINRMNEE